MLEEHIIHSCIDLKSRAQWKLLVHATARLFNTLRTITRSFSLPVFPLCFASQERMPDTFLCCFTARLFVIRFLL